nr:gp178 [uncultured Mediterranean phage uvMED]BAR25537.1 gp178 [uncultured Mediterranean phage uvMED]
MKLDATTASVKEFEIKQITIQEASTIIEEWHYSKSTNGLRVSFCFGLFYKNTLIGAMIYGHLGMANVWKKYAKKYEDVIELRRLACIDATPKNTESYFIGATLRWLKKNTSIKVIVSYADTFHNHEGTIYKASNFIYSGLTSKGRLIQDETGKTYHDKSIRTYYVNKDGVKRLKPFASRLKAKLETGLAKYIQTTGKHIYLYYLQKQ